MQLTASMTGAFLIGHRSNAGWILSLAAVGAVLLLTGAPNGHAQNRPYGPVEPDSDDRLIANFEATQKGPREFEFHWSFETDKQDQTVICQIDFDGDDLVEATIENCDDDQQIRHRYEEPGAKHVILIARSRDGGSDVARLRVTASQ